MSDTRSYRIKTDFALKNNSPTYIISDLETIVKNKVYLYLSIMRGERLFNRSKSFGIKKYIGENITDTDAQNMQMVFNAEFSEIDPENIRYLDNSAEFYLDELGHTLTLTFYFVLELSQTQLKLSVEVDLD